MQQPLYPWMRAGATLSSRAPITVCVFAHLARVSLPMSVDVPATPYPRQYHVSLSIAFSGPVCLASVAGTRREGLWLYQPAPAAGCPAATPGVVMRPRDCANTARNTARQCAWGRDAGSVRSRRGTPQCPINTHAHPTRNTIVGGHSVCSTKLECSLNIRHNNTAPGVCGCQCHRARSLERTTNSCATYCRCNAERTVCGRRATGPSRRRTRAHVYIVDGRSSRVDVALI